MKNKILYLSILLAIGFSSCNDDFLKEMGSHEKHNAMTIYRYKETANQFLDQIYYQYYAAYTSPTNTIVGVWDDENSKLSEEVGGVADMINQDKDLKTTDEVPTEYYGKELGASIPSPFSPYSRIRLCNTFLEDIETYGTNLTTIYKDQAKGQAYYLRAVQYFDLVRVYGGVPIVTKVETASAENESIKHKRATVEECVAQIIEDLDAAAAVLPMKWGTSDYGRATRASALAMKSRVLMTFASPLFNKKWDTENGVGSAWDKALQAGLTAETELSADYGLYGANAQDWATMLYKSDNTFNKEAISVRLLSPATSLANNNGWESRIRLNVQKSAQGGISVPKEMIDLFPMNDGTHPAVAVAPAYDPNKFFLNRDPRFYRTFGFSGYKWFCSDVASSIPVWNYAFSEETARPLPQNAIVKNANDNNLISPAFVIKMSDPAAIKTAFAQSGVDIMEYRYAELLLNIAECYAAMGNTTQCLDYLMKVRARVYGSVDPGDNYGLGTLADKYVALRACLYERQVELAYEGKRYWDIQRWMLFDGGPDSGANTCDKLGVTKLNGTSRTGLLWFAKTASATDPLLAQRGTISIHPDAADFAAQLAALSTFVDTNIDFVAPPKPMDAIQTPAIENKIAWNARYYIKGLKSSPLSVNPWLEQTIGWLDENNIPGTFEYR